MTEQLAFNLPEPTPPAPPPPPPPSLEAYLAGTAAEAPAFQLIVQGDDGVLRVEPFDTVAAMCLRIRELDGQPVSVVPILGYRLHISTAPNRYLLCPWGDQPLFAVAEPTGEVEPDGYLGRRFEPLPPPDAEPDEETAEDLEPDDGEEVGDIFGDTATDMDR